MILGGQHQTANRVSKGGIGIEFFQPPLSEFGAALFIVTCMSIVDGIVEPDRQFDRHRIGSQRFDLVEFSEAIGDVMLVVIVTVRLGIEPDQFLIIFCGRNLRSHRAPELHPTFWIQFAHLWSSRSWWYT